MQPASRVATGLTLALALLGAAPAVAQTCADSQLAVQVLGSGGPYPGGRASTGYLVWAGGRSVALVDAGGGVFQRFGQAGARLEDLDVVAISHLHPDHVADLTALLWLSERRTAPLVVAGPGAGSGSPAFDVFLERLSGPNGALPALGARNSALTPVVVEPPPDLPVLVHESEGLRVTALAVPHGVPALAFRVTAGGGSVVFGGDQTGASPAFGEFAVGADALVLHLALADGTPPEALAAVHATPTAVGEMAAATNVGGLVLSHLIEPPAGLPAAAAFSGAGDATLRAAVQAVQSVYAGQIAVAQDLQCIVLRP
jgi:ribonuclease BN (tRNA processing enzyme)